MRTSWNKGRKETRADVLHRQSKSHIGKKHTPQEIEKIRAAGLGEKNSNWIKDRSKIKKGETKDSIAYQNWRKEVYRRDLWKCRLKSDQCHGRIEAHHIFNWIDYPELRYLVNNGITLCRFHHPLGRKSEDRMIPIFQEIIYG